MTIKGAGRTVSKRGKNGHSAAPAPVTALRIGEAAKLLGVEAYVLRFWETEFPFLKPNHTPSRHRLYSARDLEQLRQIKHLLYEEGFTIEGARKRMRELGRGALKPAAPAAERVAATAEPRGAASSEPRGASSERARDALRGIRRDLQSLYELLKD